MQTTYDQIINHLHDETIRSLAWSLFSEDLLDGWQSPIQLDEWAVKWLNALDQQPTPLPEFSERPLGRRFEEILCFYFNNHPDWKLLAQNITIKDNGITLGEIDFLLFQKSTGKYIHLESAVKFYLWDKEAWYGPQRKDRLDSKVDKLINKQTLWCNTIQGTQQLKSMGLNAAEFERAIHCKGNLFIHKHQNMSELDWTFINKKISLLNWQTPANNLSDEYGVLKKHQWLNPLPPKSDYDVMSPINIILKRPEMVFPLNSTHNNDRLFLVPNSWSPKNCHKPKRA